ncbi:hypothetical protein ACIBCA_18375 [Kitasatospora sp. NPDC051170]|uniref:hypothetical protein n=1 Tax=Kitasatospora sp. NPDC051170 TaxID=3364056 RepID=UPI0037A6C222
MVDHPELCEDVTEALARAGFDTAPGASPLWIGPGPEGVVVGWRPADGPDGPPSGATRAAVVEAAATVLRERGHLVAGTADGGLLVTAAEPARVGAAGPDEPEALPGQWWG